MQFKHFIDDIFINLQFSRNFASMEYIGRRCNLMVDFSKFTSNKKILKNTINLSYNQFCNYTLSFGKTNINNNKTSFSKCHLFLNSSLQNDDFYLCFTRSFGGFASLKKSISEEILLFIIFLTLALYLIINEYEWRGNC